jgi:hypothetical protein
MKYCILLIAVAVNLVSSRQRLNFEDVKDKVPHVLHMPYLSSQSDLRPSTPDESLSVQLTLTVDGETGRSATIEANIAPALISEQYAEIHYQADGTSKTTYLPNAQRRCYWRGTVQFSDGSIGETAFSSCRRDSQPHIAYLNGQDLESNEFSNDFHYVNGLIRDLSNGNDYVIQPKNWVGYVEQIRNRTERRRLVGRGMQQSFAARASTVRKRRDLESNVTDAIGSNDDNEDFFRRTFHL